MRERNCGRCVKMKMCGGFQDTKAGIQDLNPPCVPIIEGRQHQVHGKCEAHPPPAEDFFSGVSMVRPQARSVPVGLKILARVPAKNFSTLLALLFSFLAEALQISEYPAL